MNKIIINGNLTKQPEMRYTTNEKAVTTFDIAVNEGFGDKKQTQFFKIVVWGKIAENCANYLDKGSKVLVSGRLSNRSYDAKDGTKKYITEIVANEVEFLGSKGNNNSNQAPQEDVFGRNFDEDIEPVDPSGDMPFK